MIRIFFLITIFFIRIFIDLYFVKNILIRIRRYLQIITNIITNFYFFNNIVAFLSKYFRIIVFICSKNKSIKITDRKINWDRSFGNFSLWKFVFIFPLYCFILGFSCFLLYTELLSNSFSFSLQKERPRVSFLCIYRTTTLPDNFLRIYCYEVSFVKKCSKPLSKVSETKTFKQKRFINFSF